jgi:hypothetical protein
VAAAAVASHSQCPDPPSIKGLEGGTTLVGESQLLEGLLRVLANNSLSEAIATPTIQTLSGQVATIHMECETGQIAKSIEIELLNHHTGNQVVFEALVKLKGEQNNRELDTAFALTEGQSCLVRLPKEESDPVADDLYG